MRTIGKYEIRGLLGRGGMGKVYKVRHPVTGKIAALKLLDPNPLLVQLIGMEKIRELFLSEAITMARLRHPNIVEIWDFDEFEGKTFYLMNFYFNNLGLIIGESMRTDEPSRRISIDRALDYCRQTLSGLDCLHHAGIIHRDIKPYNLLITDYGTIKICDFGLSKVRGEVFSGPPGLKVGSAWYAPPEQERDPDRVDNTADLYSTGVTFYRMLTGKLPGSPYRSAVQFNPDLDPHWDRFFKKSLSPRPIDRHQSARAMLDDLNDLASAWQQKKDRICLLPSDSFSPINASDPGTARIRTTPVKVSPRHARATFGLDMLWRPAAYVPHRLIERNNGIILEKTTSLIWQLSGSPYPVTWREAHEYIDTLNKENFAGLSGWRLPSIEELTTLLIETPQGQGHCLEPIFDRTQKWLWSCDRRSFIAAWYVSIEMGFVAWRDVKGRLYVRGVVSLDDI